MRLSAVLTALAACPAITAAAGPDHGEMPRSPEARTPAGERDAGDVGIGALGSSLKTCDDCHLVLDMAKSLLEGGDEAFSSLGKQLCTNTTRFDKQFCDGLVDREAPILASILRTMEMKSPTSVQFCISFLGLCDVPKVDTWAVPIPSSEPSSAAAAAAAAAAGSKGVVSGGKKPLQVIQYSDVHIDPLYKEGTSADCKKPTCCRTFNQDHVPGRTSRPAGPFGDHNCDTPMTLEKSMYQYIKKEFPDAAFALFTGDIVDHGLYNTSREYNENLIEHSYQTMHDYIDVVYATAGNHEADPPSIFKPRSVGNDTQWVYDSLAKEWSRWVGSSSVAEARAAGVYSTKYPKGNLRVISLNTNMYYRLNFALYQRTLEKDPNGQLAWLARELDAAERGGENVYIIGHMPLGSSDALPAGSNYLDQIVGRYAKTIRAMFFGHTHVDHFQISYADYANRSHANALAVSYICPSLTPTSGHPSFRVYDVDPDTFTVLDATTYIADMDAPGYQVSGPVWKKYYSAKDAYGRAVSPPLTDPAAELSPSFWHNLTAALETDDPLFDAYMARKSRGWKAGRPCRGDCKKEEICRLRAARSQDNCWKPSFGFSLGKRGETEHNHGHHDTCGASAASEWLSDLFRRQDMHAVVRDMFLAAGGKIVSPVKRA